MSVEEKVISSICCSAHKRTEGDLTIRDHSYQITWHEGDVPPRYEKAIRSILWCAGMEHVAKGLGLPERIDLKWTRASSWIVTYDHAPTYAAA